MNTKSKEWNMALRREIGRQITLIKKVDSNNDHGIMADIRADRLDKLEDLLRYEPEDKRAPIYEKN